jgi:hypothetical protein
MNKDTMRDLLDSQAVSFRMRLVVETLRLLSRQRMTISKVKPRLIRLRLSLSRASSETIYHWRISDEKNNIPLLTL